MVRTLAGMCVAEPAVWRLASPMRAAGKIEIEQDRRRHDRHARLADCKAAAPCHERIHDPGGGIEAER